MDRTRREFLQASLATGVIALAPAEKPMSNAEPAGPKPFEPAYLALERSGELRRREQRLFGMMQSCSLCPRKCGKNRLVGETGTCNTDQRVKLSSFGPHFGEEAPLVGRSGSGTIFFAYCNLLCLFCQNWEIAHRGDGRHVSAEELASVMLSLQKRGCHNINLVTPTHQVPQIVAGLRIAIAKGLRLPLVYNTGGYDSLEVIELLDGVIDIYMPDFKYQDGDLAAKYSTDASDYPERAAAAISKMHRQVGVLETDESGVARRGVILRHLVMPRNIAGTDRFVRWVARELSPDTYVNIMGQYHPAHKAFDHEELSRRITPQEIAQALAWAREAGLRRLDR